MRNKSEAKYIVMRRWRGQLIATEWYFNDEERAVRFFLTKNKDAGMAMLILKAVQPDLHN